MQKKRIIGFALTVAACGVLAAAGMRYGTASSCRIEDEEGNFLASVRVEQDAYIIDCEERDWAYADLAFHEGARLLAEELQLEETDAQVRLVRDKAVIKTCYQAEIQKVLADAAEHSPEMMMDHSAAAVTDTEGRLLACYSFSADADGKNHVTYPAWAGSTMKPLCVYGPALEEDKICWSSLEEDSPYQKVENEQGEWVDWPQNTSAYTYERKTMAQAVKESNNTIAVKTLKKLGVPQALDWLENQLRYTAEGERKLMEEAGEDAVLGNIALGYLQAGVTVKQMLENYQVFASGGVRTELSAVFSVEDKGKLYQPDRKAERVFSEETAYIVNRMLKGVTQPGGTGEAAALEGIDLCGKTGTSGESPQAEEAENPEKSGSEMLLPEEDTQDVSLEEILIEDLIEDEDQNEGQTQEADQNPGAETEAESGMDMEAGEEPETESEALLMEVEAADELIQDYGAASTDETENQSGD